MYHYIYIIFSKLFFSLAFIPYQVGGGSDVRGWYSASWSVGPENLSDFSHCSYLWSFSVPFLIEGSNLRTCWRVFTTRLGPVLLSASVGHDLPDGLLLLTLSLESLESAAPTTGHTGNLCSGRSERRGPHQQVVSFSFWGEADTGYWNGILDNLGLLGPHSDDSEDWLCVGRATETSLPWLGDETPHQSPQADWPGGPETLQPPVPQWAVSVSQY